MRIYLHIGLEHVGADRLQTALAEKRAQLADRGVLFPRSPGGRNHTRLYMAITDPDHIDPLRFNRGHITAQKQAALRKSVVEGLQREVDEAQPNTLILSAAQLGTSLHRPSEPERLRALLRPFSDDIRLVVHTDTPARMLTAHYAAQVLEGRATSLDVELGLIDQKDWWQACLEKAPEIAPQKGAFFETQAPPHWLDTPALRIFWEQAFGEDSLTVRPYDAELFNSPDVTKELRDAFDLDNPPGKIEAANPVGQPSAAWLARARQFNALLLQLLAQGNHIVPRPIWRSFMSDMRVGGRPIDPDHLQAISDRFYGAGAGDNGNSDTWREADPTLGFRASQYLLAYMFQIEKATRAERNAKAADLAKLIPAPEMQDVQTKSPAADELSDAARSVMPALAIQNYEKLKTSSFAPHNKLGAVDEEQLAAAFPAIAQRPLPKGSTGNVIVGCMKNEAPYVVEWVAYHRAIGVDNFLIYTNDCDDGTDLILDRLQAMGLVEHRNNDAWKGRSPQQHALDKALKEPVLKNAEWVIHIDVDEFINVRTGNGTLRDFQRKVPDATNIAMTWRLFGHNGIDRFTDCFVIDQFDTCAPKFCPKPHTVWGFKTMFKNIGAYEKISCHRPNKLDQERRGLVRWVNGSGRDMTKEAIENGWRNSKKSIGYDLIQLNHYALRSAESFLIKRQRGRALHVDRSIGLNYWIRMDWGDVRDITIKRNLPRLREAFDALMADDTLRELHQKGVDWHHAKALELHGMPEFEDLYQQALNMKLKETERVAYALALDMES